MFVPLRWITFPLLLLSSPALADEPPAATPPAQPAPAQPAPAQPEPEVLLAPGTPTGGWGGPFVAFGQVNGQGAMFVGGRGAWLIGRRFGVGASFQGLVPFLDGPPAGTVERDLQMSYGGLWLEVTFDPLRMVHLSTGLLTGLGSVDLTPVNADLTVEEDDFFVLEPTVLLELNLGSSVRADLGLTYRYVAGVQVDGLDAMDLSGPSLLVLLKFGKL